MKQYRETLKLQNIFLSAGSILMAVFALLAVGSELGWFSLIRPAAGDDHWQSAWYGFITGATVGLLAMMVTCLIRNRLAMKDEKKLKKRFVKDHDERNIRIVTLARNTAMQMMLFIGLAASVIAGYFSVTVSITVLIWTFVSACLSLALTGYYSKKL